jgi:hypothetical protein
MENNLSTSTGSPSRRSGKKIARIVGFTIMGILFASLFALVFGFLVKILWNWLMPAIFGLGKISYWQAFGLLILAKMLFGSFGPHHDHHQKDHFHKRVDARWHKMMGFHDEAWRKPGGSHQNWKHYKDFWQEEGQEAFDAYIKRKESEKE